MTERIVIGDAVLYHGDCLEILPSLGKVDCVVTDPPYGISHQCNFKSRGRSKLAVSNDYPNVHNDNVPFDPSIWLALNVPTLFWGGNWFADKLPPSGGWLVWDKERPDSLDQATCELAWSNFIKGVRRFRFLWHGMMRAGERGENYHPTQKPVALSRWILSLRWMPSGILLDPYMGAGPNGIACVERGRKFIGIEIERKYFDIACRRIESAQQQGKLFH